MFKGREGQRKVLCLFHLSNRAEILHYYVQKKKFVLPTKPSLIPGSHEEVVNNLVVMLKGRPYRLQTVQTMQTGQTECYYYFSLTCTLIFLVRH